jgi:hypothetical protein
MRPHVSQESQVVQTFRPLRGGRDTLAFSKKLANHIGAIKYFICHYNLTKAAALLV